MRCETAHSLAASYVSSASGIPQRCHCVLPAATTEHLSAGVAIQAHGSCVWTATHPELTSPRVQARHGVLAAVGSYLPRLGHLLLRPASLQAVLACHKCAAASQMRHLEQSLLSALQSSPAGGHVTCSRSALLVWQSQCCSMAVLPCHKCAAESQRRHLEQSLLSALRSSPACQAQLDCCIPFRVPVPNQMGPFKLPMRLSRTRSRHLLRSSCLLQASACFLVSQQKQPECMPL